LTLGGFEAPGNTTLSEPDKEAIAVAYPFEKATTELSTETRQEVTNEPGQVQRYRFSVAAAQKYVLELQDVAGHAELSLFGPGSASRSLTGDDKGMPVWSVRVERVLEPGVYYVKVRQKEATAAGSSSLRLLVP